MNHSIRIGQKVKRIVSLAEELSSKSDNLTEKCYQLLDTEPSFNAYRVGASCLNNDSTPLQLCLTSSQKNVSLRVIGDPGAYHHISENRFNSSVKTLFHFINQKNANELEKVTRKTIDLLIPQNSEERKIYKQGFIWIAVKPEKPGIAFYLELAPLGYKKGWNAVENWLQNVLPSYSSAQKILSKLKEHCIVASAGLEGSTVENTRAKLYFRFREHVNLDAINLDIFSSEEMQYFQKITQGDFHVDLQGFVMNIGFSLASGELSDAKIDLCGHCIRHSPQDWSAVINKITSKFNLAPMNANQFLESEEFEVAFVGFGLTTTGIPRLNVYIKHDSQIGQPESEELSGALEDGIRYLLAQQKEEGNWIDYQLPVGSSDQWVTAYAAHALAVYGNKKSNNEALSAATKAAKWLLTDRSYTAGWGYHGLTGADSDSTAMTIALLDELGMDVDEKDRAFLTDHWKENEGIATYHEPGAWAVGHWDVTPWGFHGMTPGDQIMHQNQFIAAMNKNFTADGFWRTYWWKNPYYSTFITLEVLEKLGIPEPDIAYQEDPSSIQIDNPFDLACYIGIECIRDPNDFRISGHLRALLNWQSRNGMWYGSENLRVTDNFCYEPWDKPSGKYYQDINSIITTATVTRVLSNILPTQNSENDQQSYFWM